MTSDRTLMRLGRLLAGIAVAVALISMGILAVLQRDFLIAVFVVQNGIIAVGFGSLAWVAFRTQQRNGAVWALAWAAFFGAVFAASVAIVVLWGEASFPEFSLDFAGTLTPSELPLGVALAVQTVAWAYIPAFLLVLTLGLLLFPDGRPPSPRWRWVGWYSVVTIALAVAPWIWLSRPSSTVPLNSAAEAGTAGQLAGVFLALALLGAVLSVAALVVRYRQSSGVTRRQIRWIALGASLLVATLVVSSVVDGVTGESGTVSNSLIRVGEALLILSFWVAITKYRLYDIDVVISKTVTYGALGIFITAVYVAIVVGIGALVGGGDEPNLVLAIGATALVALLFEPMRSRLQRWANRVVFGERATPYEVLARFSKRAATAEGDTEMLERIPRLIVDGTSASEATLWIADDGVLKPAALWPEQESALQPANADTQWSDMAADYSVPVEHDGELLGGLSLVASRGETIAPAEEELVQNLAGGLGLALRNARLTDDLREQVDELAASRERILSAADEARRGLEQDLDMGPQQELVAVKVKLGVVKSQAAAANAPKTAEVLAQLEQDTGTAIESVRDFARGVYPPLLEAEGLAVAVSAEGAKSALPVAIQSGDVGRYPREVETAVFFSILESLQNAAKYSEATSATVTLDDDGERLRFSVIDDGLGFDPAAVDGGSGIPGMADRLDAAGGRLKIESAPGSGTTVLGSVPI